MRDLAIVYWSATGNTEAMAAAVAEGARSTGAQVRLMTAAEASPDQLAACDGIAFGCPAMGAEQLEETEFEPLFSACEGQLNGKALALFGSYGWGGGEWMSSWEARCTEDGARLVCPSVICCETPDQDTLAACRSPGLKRQLPLLIENSPHSLPCRKSPFLLFCRLPPAAGRRGFCIGNGP